MYLEARLRCSHRSYKQFRVIIRTLHLATSMAYTQTLCSLSDYPASSLLFWSSLLRETTMCRQRCDKDEELYTFWWQRLNFQNLKATLKSQYCGPGSAYRDTCSENEGILFWCVTRIYDESSKLGSMLEPLSVYSCRSFLHASRWTAAVKGIKSYISQLQR